MNPEIKAKWVAALRSKKYQQAKKALRKDVDGKSAFCCLGVLCEIYNQEVPENEKVDWVIDDEEITEDRIKSGEEVLGIRQNKNYSDRDLPVSKDSTKVYTESKVIPQIIIKWAGLRGSNPVISNEVNLKDFKVNPKDFSLAELNDQGKTFEEIADIIEQGL